MRSSRSRPVRLRLGGGEADRNAIGIVTTQHNRQIVGHRRTEHSAPEDPLQRACAYLQFFFHRNVSLQQIAKGVAYLSPGHLSKLFRERYGVSFQSYLQRLRLNKAADLLINTALPVALVARRSGYRDTSRFGQHFRREYGNSPLAWRKARRKNKKA